MLTAEGTRFKRSFYGTISYIPALFGLQMASVVVQEVAAGKTVNKIANSGHFYG
jgi:tRNA A37 threonylcarbamoyladenosine dehydratase